MDTFINFISQIDVSQLVDLVKELYRILLSLSELLRGSSTAIITNGSGG